MQQSAAGTSSRREVQQERIIDVQYNKFLFTCDQPAAALSHPYRYLSVRNRRGASVYISYGVDFKTYMVPKCTWIVIEILARPNCPLCFTMFKHHG